MGRSGASAHGSTARWSASRITCFTRACGGAGRCYLAELFVTPEVRRRGIATAMIGRVAQDADEHGAPRLYWNTEVDAEARTLYDRIAVYRGYIVYNYSPSATAAPRGLGN
ncbi:GNAT family N-acetyltransferase [Micromonospora sp. RB23]